MRTGFATFVVNNDGHPGMWVGFACFGKSVADIEHVVFDPIGNDGAFVTEH